MTLFGNMVRIVSMPVPVVGHIGVVHNQKIIVFGGDINSTFVVHGACSIGYKFIQEYDPASDSWRLMRADAF